MSFRNAARLLGDLGASENPLAWASGAWVERDGGSMWPVLSIPQHIQAAAATIACDAAAGVVERARGGPLGVAQPLRAPRDRALAGKPRGRA
jgi:hypothetical protein